LGFDFGFSFCFSLDFVVVYYYSSLVLLAGGSSIPAWRGGLNISYNIGPGPVVVNLALEMNFTVSNIWNVIADVPGESDEAVLLGNHRDAWVFGGVDPSVSID
jgi:N-acetylated-alpha-linked acidic dipeptidase